MSNDMVKLEVDPNLVNAILEKQIQAAIVTQLGDQDKLIESIVKKALSKKVNADGKVDNYSHYNKFDFLEILATKSIQVAATSALQDWLQQNSIKVKQAVMDELETPGRQRSIAVAYADVIEHSLKCSWNMGCNITFCEKETD